MFLLPTVSLAKAGSDLAEVATGFQNLIGILYQVVIAGVFVAFAWGVLTFIFKAGDDKEKGQSMMIWSVIAIVVLFSIQGIVALVQDTTNTGGDGQLIAPTIPTVTLPK